MLLIWKWDKIPSLREINNKICEAAQRGFSSIGIDFGIIPINSVLMEGLKGCCRSGYRHRSGIYICVSDYSEVMSVPSLRKDGFLDVTKPKAAEYVWEIMLKPMLRRLEAFSGKELKGIVLQKPTEGRADYFYEYMGRQCILNGISLVNPENCVFIEQNFKNTEYFGNKICEIIEKNLESEKYVIAAKDSDFPNAPSSVGDSMFTSLADRLKELFAQGLKECGETAVRSFKNDSGTVVYYSNAQAEQEITIPQGHTAYIEDIADENRYSFEGGKVYFQPGGVLVLHVEKNPSFNKPLPKFLKCGVSFCEADGAEVMAMPVEAGENRLPVKDEFEAQFAEGEFYFSSNSESIVFNGTEIKTENAKADLTGLVRMGINRISSGGILSGEFFTDGRSVVPPREIMLGDVSEMGMPYYEGEIVYEAKLPDSLTADNYLILKGSFAAAKVEIGRRKEILILSPFAVPLFEADSGRIAKISIFTAPKLNEITETSDCFGLNIIEIV